MLSAPPPNRGVAGSVEMSISVVDVMVCDAMWLRRKVLGSSSIACVIVPAGMKDVRSCGIRGVFLLDAVWLANLILELGWSMVNGVMSLDVMVGGPLVVEKVP